ncbi:uncharacterized protein HGUI_01886 [Hanseniaspora guilliermondii]|uniref:Uncharacterized protein n=1 Tax=Hanseniaspora guilliermondii TaxID=56406 RepID=A0A1L0FJB4_9ASCO|nr:uncharacterized protein HGUI_01886 [Hanseniaspora guilliermondii]
MTTRSEHMTNKLNDLVWNINEFDVWSFISDLKNKTITDTNCNINSEKFKKIIELDEQFQKSDFSSKNDIQLNEQHYSVNDLYKRKLDFSEHTQNSKITSLKSEENYYLVGFSNIKFFKMEDVSRKSYFEYNIPNMKIHKESFNNEYNIKSDSNDHGLHSSLLQFLTDKIVCKLDQLYVYLNCVSYSPKYLHYYSFLLSSLATHDQMASDSKVYNYKHISTVLVEPSDEISFNTVKQTPNEDDAMIDIVTKNISPKFWKDDQDTNNTNFSTLYSSTKMRILDQSLYGYEWPFQSPEEGFHFLTMFLMQDLDSYVDKFDELDIMSFYKSYALSLKNLDISKSKNDKKIENFNKYLDFINRSQNDKQVFYDPIADLLFSLWEYLKLFLLKMLPLLNSCQDAAGNGSLLGYFGYSLSMKNHKFDEVISFTKVTTTLSKFVFGSSLHDHTNNYKLTENFFDQDYFYFKLSDEFTDKKSDVLQRLEQKSFYFTEYKKLMDRVANNDQIAKNPVLSFVFTVQHFSKFFQKYFTMLFGNSTLHHLHNGFDNCLVPVYNVFMELKTNDIKLDLGKITSFRESIGNDNFNIMDMFAHMSINPREYLPMYDNAYNSDFSSRETYTTRIHDEWKQALANSKEIDIVSNMRFSSELIEMRLKDRDVLISPVSVNKEGNIFKFNRFVLEEHSLREIIYSLLIQEVYLLDSMALDPWKERVLQIVLSFADSYGRPSDQNTKIMSLDRTADLMIGMIVQMMPAEHERNEFENNEVKRKLAAFFAQIIMTSLTDLHMDVLNYELLAIDDNDDWISTTDHLFDFKFTIRYIEIIFNANILMTYCIQKITKHLSPTGYNPYVDLMAWCWASCNLNLSIFLKIDQIIEASNASLNDDEESDDEEEEGPYILKSLILLTSGWRYLLGTILNRKMDDYAIRHELEHLSFDQYMAPTNRKFSSGALSSVSIELLENYMNLIYKSTFIDFNKKDELAMNNPNAYEAYSGINHKFHMHDFFNQNTKEASFFEYLDIIPDDDLDDDVLYVFRDYFEKIETYGVNDTTGFVDQNNTVRHYIFDYRLLNKTRVDHMKKYGDYTVPKTRFSAIEEFVEASQNTNCSCSVTQTFIKKIKELDMKKRTDITDDELVFVSDTKEFCPLEELKIFSSFVTYPYLSDNKYTFDAYFPIKPIVEINLKSCIEKFVNLSHLKDLDKMNLLCEVASINYHFNEVFNKGIVFSQEEVFSQIDAESLNMNPDEGINSNLSQLSDMFSMSNGSDKKAFDKSVIAEVKACFNLRGEFLQILFKTDDQIFKLMEDDYFFAERLLDEFLMDKFYLCWINCCFSLVKLNSEEDYYKHRYFFFYMFKLLSRSIGSKTDEKSILDDCYLVKDHPKFNLLKKSYFENTVLPELDHALNYLEVLVDYTASYMRICEEGQKESSDKILKLLDFQLDFYLSQLQGIYLGVLSISESGFDNKKSSEFLYCSPITRCFLLNVADKACPGAFPFSFKDSSVFMTLIQIIRDLSYILGRMIDIKHKRGDVEGTKLAQEKFNTFYFIQLELNKYLHFDESKEIVEFSGEFNLAIEKSNKFKDYELGVYLYSKHLTNKVKNDPCYKNKKYTPMDLVRMYNTFFETSTVYPGMNVNVFIKNGMSFKHSVEHELDLEEGDTIKVTTGFSNDSNEYSDGFIFKSIY